MLEDTRMTNFLMLHHMANENDVTREKIWAVVEPALILSVTRLCVILVYSVLELY